MKVLYSPESGSGPILVVFNENVFDKIEMLPIESKDGVGDYWLDSNQELIAAEFEEGALLKGKRAMRIDELKSTLLIRIEGDEAFAELVQDEKVA
jgi:hypothetical protein